MLRVSPFGIVSDTRHRLARYGDAVTICNRVQGMGKRFDTNSPITELLGPEEIGISW